MPFCLPKYIVDDFFQALKSGKIDPVKMMDMSSQERSDLFAEILGEDNARKVNALYESKLLLKDQQAGMITWIKNVAGISPKVRDDIIARVSKMDKILTPESEDAFYKDLAAQKLGVTVTMEEAANISGLAKIATEKKEAMKKSERRGRFSPNTPTEKEYGMAGIAFRNYLAELKRGEQLTGGKILDDPIGSIKRMMYEVAGDPTGTFLIAAGISKTMKTVWDDSAVLRQGAKILFSHPDFWYKNTLNTFRDIYNTLGGKAVMDEINASVISHPLHSKMVRDKVAIATVEEEIPQARILEGVPYIGKLIEAADNVFTGFMYRNRIDFYELYTYIAERQGITDTKDMGLGLLVNSMTSRGNLGKLEPVADILNVAFFSVRNMKANFDILTAFLFSGKKTSKFVKIQAAKELIKIATGMTAALAVAGLMGADIEWDPTSTDFGKARIGNTRYDFTGGMGSMVTLVARLFARSKKSSTTGKRTPTWGSGYLTQDGLDLIEDFFENKIAPFPQVGINVFLKGHTYQGEPITIWNTIRDLTVPITTETIAEIWKDPKAGPLLLSILAELFGASTQTYGPKKQPEGFGGGK